MEQLDGPDGPIHFDRDALGYPSIHARDMIEGSFALGYLHARDRLVQVTLNALASRGELMSALGDVPVARLIDYSVRSVGMASDVGEQAELCDPESRRLLDAYCRGFNRGARERGTPLVLRLLGLRPFYCTPAGVVAVFRFIGYFGLTSMQLSTELIVMELAARGAPRRVFERLLGPHAAGLDLDAIRNVKLPSQFSFFANGVAGSTQAGSNAFAVAGARSHSGGALLMGEFHMPVGTFPPLLYAAHLALPDDEYVTGITVPGLAWFAAGRTRHVGWSYTFAHADNVDFLIEHVKDGRYLVGGEYRALRRREESIAIRGKPGETWVFHHNDYGTVLGDVNGEHDLPCVRLSGLSETHRAFSAARRVPLCRSVDELAAIQREVKNVSLEAIMADSSGAIASVVTGQIDRRPAGWTGAYPRARGTLAAESPEPMPESTRPVALRPGSGALVSANQGGQGPHREAWCTYPEPLYRFERISELMAARPQHDLQSLLRISYDVFDASARRLLPIWAPLLPEHPQARALAAWVADQKDRELLSLFHKLHEEVSFALLEQDIGRTDARRFREWSALAFFQPQLDAVLALERPALLDATALRELLARAFPAALAGYREHDVPVRLRFKHLVTRGRSPALFGFDSPLIELPGSPVTPFQCRLSPISGEGFVYAPAFHLLFDMSRPYAWYNLPGGASESRFGPGYGKGVDEWLHGTLLPLGNPGAAEIRLER